jgi:hypothetical protein
MEWTNQAQCVCVCVCVGKFITESVDTFLPESSSNSRNCTDSSHALYILTYFSIDNARVIYKNGLNS